MLAGVGSMWAQGSKSIVCFGGNTAESGYDFITSAQMVNDVTSFRTTLEADGTSIELGLNGGRMWAIAPTGTWTNTYALDMMNAVLNSNFTVADFSQGSPLKFSSPGWQDKTCSMTFTFSSSNYDVGDAIVFYLSLSSNQTSLSNFSVTGLDEATITYACNNGSGFTSTATYSSGIGAITIVKVVGKVTSNPVVFSSTTAKNGWQTISYCPWTEEAQEAEAEPAAFASLDAKLAKARLIGTGVSHYTDNNEKGKTAGIVAAAEALLTKETTTKTEIDASIAALDGIYEKFTLNMPEAGKLYRLKGYASKNYMAPTAATPNANADTKMAMNADMDLLGTIFMFTNGDQVDSQAGYKLWNYNTGYYTKKTHNLGAMASAANSMSIRKATSDNPGCYMLQTNSSGIGTWIYDNYTVVDRNGSYAAGNCDWTMEEVTWLPIPVSNTYKIGTFVSPVPLRQDDTILKFYTGEIVDDYLVLTKHEGNIPANTPFLIEYQDGATYANGCVNLDIAASADELGKEVTNNLAGSIETIAKPAGTIYTLQPDSVDPTVLTFRIFNGTNVAGGKAYLPAASPVKGIRYNTGETTGIEGVATEKANKEIFDLSGRRVQNPTSGLYIINGQKVYVK